MTLECQSALLTRTNAETMNMPASEGTSPFAGLAESTGAHVAGKAAISARSPSGPLIYQTIVDLANSNLIATRSVLMGATGLSYSVIDDHVKRMIDEGRVRRVMNGVFEAVPPSPEDRAVSITHLPGGGCKLEIGDWCSDLSLREMRMIAMATAGVSLQFGR